MRKDSLFLRKTFVERTQKKLKNLLVRKGTPYQAPVSEKNTGKTKNYKQV